MSMTHEKYAEHRKCSIQMVEKYKAAGLLVLDARGKIDPEASDKSLAAKLGFNHSSTEQGTEGKRSPLETYNYYRAALKKSQAEISRSEADLLAAKLVDRAAVVNDWADMLTIIRQRVTGMADRLAPKLVMVADERAAHDIIMAEVRDVVDKTTAKMKKWNAKS